MNALNRKPRKGDNNNTVVLFIREKKRYGETGRERERKYFSLVSKAKVKKSS